LCRQHVRLPAGNPVQATLQVFSHVHPSNNPQIPILSWRIGFSVPDTF
jgi:hypothetical protein